MRGTTRRSQRPAPRRYGEGHEDQCCGIPKQRLPNSWRSGPKHPELEPIAAGAEVLRQRAQLPEVVPQILTVGPERPRAFPQLEGPVFQVERPGSLLGMRLELKDSGRHDNHAGSSYASR